MIIFPAIDIIGGKPVRLYKGDFSTAQQVCSGRRTVDTYG